MLYVYVLDLTEYEDETGRRSVTIELALFLIAGHGSGSGEALLALGSSADPGTTSAM